MLDTSDAPRSPERPRHPARDSLGLVQSLSTVSESSLDATDDDDDDYSVPLEIEKGYTQCFFGYGKYLHLNGRAVEGIRTLLDCCVWYADAFVDPSCLTSLILPPQFLFQDSVKKTNCVSFRTLSKFVSKLCADEQKRLDREFKKLKVAKFIKEYDAHLNAYLAQNDDFDLPTATLEGYDTNSTRSVNAHFFCRRTFTL